MKKIAIFLPQTDRGSTFREAKNIAKAIQYQSNIRGNILQVIFSCVQGVYDLESEFNDLYELGIKVRETAWKQYSTEQIEVIKDFFSSERKIKSNKFIVPSDGANDFLDCDYWFYITDRCKYTAYPFKKYGVLFQSYIQRYVPDIFNDYVWEIQDRFLIPFVKNAEFILTSTLSTKNDLISYAGIPAEKISLVNFNFDSTAVNRLSQNAKSNGYGDFFVWVINDNDHKSDERCIKALVKYYEEYDGKLNVIVLGKQKNKYINKIRSMAGNFNIPRNKLFFIGNASDSTYAGILKHAKFLFHTNLYDDYGTHSVIEAACLGTPSLSSLYPPMQYFNEMLNLNLTFFDPYNVEEMASKLKFMEEQYKHVDLPSKEELEKFSWKNNSYELYETVMNHFIRIEGDCYI